MLKIAFDKFVLQNGLTVILHVDRSSPLVAVELWYHVGSKDESPGRTGFRAPVRAPDVHGLAECALPGVRRIMESWGGHNNGTTSNDRTNYYEIGPRNLLETFLWLEADRLATLSDVITDRSSIASARSCRTSAGSPTRTGPTARAELEIPDAMYPPDHPYHWPTIGSHADSRPPASPTSAFFERFTCRRTPVWWWRATSTPAEARRLIDKYFGWQPKPAGAAAPRRRPSASRSTTSRRRSTIGYSSRACGSSGMRRALFPPGDADSISLPTSWAVASPAGSTSRWCSSVISRRTCSRTRARSSTAACFTSAPPPSPP